MWLAIAGDVVQVFVIAWIVQKWRQSMVQATDIVRRLPASDEAYPNEEEEEWKSSGGSPKRRPWNWPDAFKTLAPAIDSKSASTGKQTP